MKNRIVTYADGFGNWHATVHLATPKPLEAVNEGSVRAVARRAIRRELEARAPRAGLGGYRVKIEVEKSVYGSENRLCSITFRERF